MCGWSTSFTMLEERLVLYDAPPPFLWGRAVHSLLSKLQGMPGPGSTQGSWPCCTILSLAVLLPVHSFQSRKGSASVFSLPTGKLRSAFCPLKCLHWVDLWVGAAPGHVCWAQVWELCSRWCLWIWVIRVSGELFYLQLPFPTLGESDQVNWQWGLDFLVN